MKAANSYASLLRGVSQQAAHERADGQLGEQVNLLSDPVNGLTRRHGSYWQAESNLGLPSAQFASYLADTATWTSYDFTTGGKSYTMLYRRQARPVTANPLPLCLVYNKTDKVFLNYTRQVTDTALDSMEAAGVSAAVAIGKYVFMANRGGVFAGTSTNLWDDPENFSRAVVWIRGGAFSRTFRVTVRKQDGTAVTVSYTTPASSYQGTLTTTDIPATASDYTKQVNDRVNAYNSAVTAWIGTSTAAVQPSAIAEQLRILLAAASMSVTRNGSHICFATIPTWGNNVRSIEVDDGGDGSLIRGVADEVEAADKLSVIHRAGKIVKVRPKGTEDAYYLKAVPKDQSNSFGYVEVTWVEAAGVQHTINSGLFYGTVNGSNFCVASSASGLATLVPGTHPTFNSSTSGDHDTSPMPFFVGRTVTYLGSFQNRLLVGCGGSLAVSQTEEYLNFFRTTVLTLPADDPFEMFPQGSEDDNLTSSALYDQDLVIFGTKRQYVISGTVALTPTSANMPVIASYADAVGANPVAAGGYVMYAKRSKKSSDLFQIQPGQNDKSPEAFPASSQLSDYINGGSVELVSMTGSPSYVFMRTDKAANSLYAFTYLDRQDGRKMDSWSRWDFHADLGRVMGMSPTPDGLLVFFMRLGAGNRVYIVADLCSLGTGLNDQPYLDSLRPIAAVTPGTGSVSLTSGAAWSAAFNHESTKRLTGSALAGVAALQASYPTEPGLMVGANYSANFTPTNPYMRDNKDSAILSGSLTVSFVILAYSKSGGFSWTVAAPGATTEAGSFNGRVMGDPDNIVGIEPISTGGFRIPVGRETRSYTLNVASRTWMPMTITSMEWVGQFFNRVQRF